MGIIRNFGADDLDLSSRQRATIDTSSQSDWPVVVEGRVQRFSMTSEDEVAERELEAVHERTE